MKSDSELVESLTRRLRAGEEEAYREFYDRYSLRLMRYLVSLHRGDVGTAKDTFQNTVLRVGRYVKVFRDEAVFVSWILRLAKTAFLDENRKLSRYQRLLERFGTSLDGSAVESKHGGLADSLVEALGALEPNAARLLDDFYRKGLSYAEIGLGLGISARAVEGRLARARAGLRELIIGRADNE